MNSVQTEQTLYLSTGCCIFSYPRCPYIYISTTLNSSTLGVFKIIFVTSALSLQVTRSVDTEGGQLSPQEQKTVDAIVKAR